MLAGVVSIHQPSYFAWLGLLDKINKSDCYIIMDEVQLSDSSYQNRNIFLANGGNVKYLNVNISKKGYKDKHLKDLELSNAKWQQEHLNFLDSNYKKHPYYNEVFSMIEGFYKEGFDNLGDVLSQNMLLTLKLFGIDTKVVRQSELDYDRSARKGDLVIALIKAVDYSTYCSGAGAKSYMNEDDFTKEKIKLIYQSFTHPEYPQLNSTDKFVPGLSCLDYLFNCGLTEAKNVFKNSK